MLQAVIFVHVEVFFSSRVVPEAVPFQLKTEPNLALLTHPVILSPPVHPPPKISLDFPLPGRYPRHSFHYLQNDYDDSGASFMPSRQPGQSRVQADAGSSYFQLWPSVGIWNRAGVFGPILGRHSCRDSTESATGPGPMRFFWRAELGPMLALVSFDYGPVTAVSAPGIGPVYSARFWGVIHAEPQPSRQPDPARLVSSGEPSSGRCWPWLVSITAQ
ncbi:hypothetical protein VZT92_014574 [Zoarces viviparus]|uniref:Uncharacterized protein n=2 Tax=Zoarces viviparus TaxID=48416 RepID=A0AAW1F1C7_ZOAVI